MGLRTKLNLVLAIVALGGVLLFALGSTPLLEGVARDEVLQSSRIMMESAAGTRQYTSQEVAPLLSAEMGQAFHPQAVSAYAAKKNFAVLHAAPCGKMMPFTYVAGTIPWPATKLPEVEPGSVASELSMIGALDGS